MPWVEVYTGPSVTHAQRLAIRTQLPVFIANALSCADPGGQLGEDDMELLFPVLDEISRSSFDIAVKLQAMAFPSRLANAEERITQIGRSLKEMFPLILTICVWAQIGGHFVWWNSEDAETD